MLRHSLYVQRSSFGWSQTVDKKAAFTDVVYNSFLFFPRHGSEVAPAWLGIHCLQPGLNWQHFSHLTLLSTGVTDMRHRSYFFLKNSFLPSTPKFSRHYLIDNEVLQTHASHIWKHFLCPAHHHPLPEKATA